ncbi:MAG: bifunctional riboflavin kinase/FAD synthetase, partial [Flavobacteriaceae bacterium]|nr:bifunctional riboflavin kinase/FAD synthetase [Flavobacteriaceae bacterium]
MEIHTESFNLPQNRKIVFTLGMFDGVHSGHQFVLEHLKKIAEEEEGETAVMTFVPHPRLVLQPDADFRLLTTLKEKISLLEKFSVQHLFIQEFTEEFSKLTAREFVRDILVARLNIHSLVVGYDHQFGKNRDGNFEQLQDFSKEFGFNLHQLPPVSEQEVMISSTKIRNKINDGDIKQANQWLGYKFVMTGKVIEGDKIGRKLGYPTANMEIDKHKICPKNGVYFVKVRIGGESFDGMLNIGMRPTISGTKKQVEVHILNFNRDIYGEEIEVHFYDRERDEEKFSSLEELKQRLASDKKNTVRYF